MGFSVTAAYAIFAVAMLTALSAASGAYWKNASYFESSRRVMDERVVHEAHSNLTITSAAWHSGNTTEVFTIKNTGSTGVDYTRFTFLFDGAYDAGAQSTGYPKLNAIYPATSDLLLPGDSLDVQFALSQQPTTLQVVNEYGTFAHYP